MTRLDWYRAIVGAMVGFGLLIIIYCLFFL